MFHASDCRRGGIFLLAAAFFLMALAACAHQAVPLPRGFVPPDHDRLIPNVPFFPDDSKQCGPASLASVLNFHGGHYTVSEISAAVFRPDLGGTVNLEMIYFARTQGYQAEWFSGTPADVVKAIDLGQPLVVMVNYGVYRVSKYHYMVVTGYSPDGITANSGMEKSKHIPWEDFWQDWSKADRWTLLIKGRK